MLLTTVLGPLQEPPASGDPPNAAKMFAEVLVLHTLSVPFEPAFGAACSVTVTVALAFTAQGEVAFTV